MFKKFLLTFIFCMSVFGITAFAEVSTFAIAPNDIEYTYVTYFYNSDGQLIQYYSDYEFYVDSSDIIRVGGPTVQFCDDLFLQNLNLGNGICNINDDTITGLVINASSVGGTGSIIPPEVAPTVKEAIAKIVPDLSAQLKILLPVGVLILSTVLGVSLVRRLVPLFL